jgi:NADH:ubiquinone oxidoreductase subunit F (NADH-binding)/NADH:ubiquinone oxidoreductase subunit E
MLTEALVRMIEEITSRYPRKESALLPALDSAQRANAGFLSKATIRDIALQLGVSFSKAYGVATYYTMFNTRRAGCTYHLCIDTNIPALLCGAEEILRHCENRLGIGAGETTPDARFMLSTVEDLGSCGTCPVIQVNDTYYENMTIAKTDELIDSLQKGIVPPPKDESHFSSVCNILLKNRGMSRPLSIAEYATSGGYHSLAKARAMQPAEVLDIVKRATVRGRGGAGFPAGMKWGFLPKNDPRPVYLICNADEGEPGTFKDRQIMQYDPHLLIEGMAIAAHTIGSVKAFIYIRGEFRWIADILGHAIDEAKQAGVLGDCDIVVHQGAGSYECGEETALIESLEGKRGCPRIKPPFPATAGLYGCPTIVNNVETLSLMPFIIGQGANAFRAIGRTGNYGPKLFGISGHVNKPGVYEYPLGTPLLELLESAGGVNGVLKAVIVGGLSAPVLTADEITGLKMDYDSCVTAGTMLGSGGIIVMNDTVSIPRIALRTIEFYAHESCGQCTPCREGSITIESLIKRIIEGCGEKKDIDKILDLCDSIIGTTLCPTGDAFAMPVRAMVRKFRVEFEALVSM